MSVSSVVDTLGPSLLRPLVIWCLTHPTPGNPRHRSIGALTDTVTACGKPSPSTWTSTEQKSMQP